MAKQLVFRNKFWGNEIGRKDMTDAPLSEQIDTMAEALKTPEGAAALINALKGSLSEQTLYDLLKAVIDATQGVSVETTGATAS